MNTDKFWHMSWPLLVFGALLALLPEPWGLALLGVIIAAFAAIAAAHR